ncbi:MAG: exodeoxyribonuclease VII large subunit, partial [Candidatus Kapaibacterium sp.]
DAISDSRTPIISAGGHETDVCIADMVADFRAPTPSLAAVACSRVTVDDLRLRIDDIASDISDLVTRVIGELSAKAREWTDGTVRSLVLRHVRHQAVRMHADRWTDGTVGRTIRRRIAGLSGDVQMAQERMGRMTSRTLRDRRLEVRHADALLRSLRPLAPLDRGFALLYKDGHVVRPKQSLNQGDAVVIRRSTESVNARIESGER